MTRRFAILLDGGFVTRRLAARLGRFPAADDVVLECDRIAADPAIAGLVLLRTYFYDAPPAAAIVTNPLSSRSLDLGRTATHANRSRLHDELELRPNVALRSGELSIHGWRLRERALHDMVPAFKFARREGLRVVLDHLGAPVKRELKVHADVVL